MRGATSLCLSILDSINLTDWWTTFFSENAIFPFMSELISYNDSSIADIAL